MQILLDEIAISVVFLLKKNKVAEFLNYFIFHVLLFYYQTEIKHPF